MMTHHTLQQLKSLKLDGMARAFEDQLTLPAAAGLAFEERFGLLVDHEITWRDNKRRDRLLWLRHAQSLLIGGATGTGKTWLACAFGQQACRQGFSVLYRRLPRLLESLRIAHGDGSFGRLLAQLARIDLLILDDWALAPLDTAARHDLLEVIDDRAGTRSTLITSQVPVDHWHGWLNDPTLADAILDRLVHRSHRLILKGESLRKSDPQNHPEKV